MTLISATTELNSNTEAESSADVQLALGNLELDSQCLSGREFDSLGSLVFLVLNLVRLKSKEEKVQEAQVEQVRVKSAEEKVGGDAGSLNGAEAD